MTGIEPEASTGGTAAVGTLSFSRSELEGRRARVIQWMRDEGVDALLVSSYPNYYYLSGLGISVGLGIFTMLLTQRGDGYWIGRRTEMSNVANFIAVGGWSEIARSIRDEEEPYEALARTVEKVVGRSATIGIELDARSFSPAGIDLFRRSAPNVKVVNSSGVVENAKAIKSPSEIDYMRRAGAITAGAVSACISRIELPMTDSTLATIVVDELLSRGSGPPTYFPAAVAGPRSALAHTTCDNSQIQPGELINIETSGVVAGYCAPVFRIAIVGRPSDDLARFHDASRDALLAALDKIGPGMTFHDGDRVVREVIEQRGYLDYFTVRAAYGIGINWVDDYGANLRPNDARTIQPGMTFHVVPALYRPGVGAVCCSTAALVTENGLESLVPIEPKLFVVDAAPSGRSSSK